MSEEHPDVIIKEWSCLPNERDFWGIHDLRRSEKRYGSENISDLNLWKASFMWPLEQRLVYSSSDLETELLTLYAVVQKKLLDRVCRVLSMEEKPR